MWIITTFCFLVIFETSITEATYLKRWIRNDNYDTPSNWVEGEKPCQNQRAVFPGEIEGAVILPAESIDVSEIILPISGELLLPSIGELIIKEPNRNEEKFCPSGDKHFRRLKRWFWLDPKNWDLMSSNEDQLKESWYSFPDAEKIPCQADVAIFEGDSGFEVVLPHTFGYSISGIQINSVDLYGSDWERFIRSEVGGRMFRNTDSESTEGLDTFMKVFSGQCNDPSGCLCHPKASVRATLMRHMKNSTVCELPNCVQPVKPIGNVCSICGAVLQFDFIDVRTFKLNDFRKSLTSIVKEMSRKGELIAYASKVTDNEDPTVEAERQFIQVVLTDGPEYNERSIYSAAEVQRRIIGGNFGLRSKSTFTSGYYYNAKGHSIGVWIVLSTLVAVCAMLGTIYYIYVGPRQKIGFGLNFNRPQFGIPNILPAAARRSFLFARFDNTSTDGGAVDLAACAIASEGSVASSLYDMEDTFENTEYSPNLQEAGERAVATFSELQKREQEEQADLLNLNDIEE